HEEGHRVGKSAVAPGRRGGEEAEKRPPPHGIFICQGAGTLGRSLKRINAMSTAAELDEPSPDEAAAPPAQAGRMPLFVFVRGLAALYWSRVQAAAVLGVVVPAFIAGFVTARSRPRVERVRIGIERLGAGFDGTRIVQISDLHVGQTLGRRFLEGVVEQ